MSGPRIRVAVDATPLLLRSSGIKNYIYYWLLHLEKVADPGSLVLFPFLRGIGKLNHERSILGRGPTLARIAFLAAANLKGNPMLNLLGRRLDLFHATNIHVFNPPTNTRLSVTIHDMTCWLMPELHTAANVAANKYSIERIARRADGVIAVSENTRQDAIRILGLRPERVRTIYSGVADEFFARDPEAENRVRAAYRLTRPYILFVGTIEPRKNLGLLLDAYTALSPSTREQFELVVAGPAGWAARETLARLRSGAPGVRYLGYVPEADLPALTRGAAVFAYPSLYEGFGFPVAQAMAAGVAVLTSNVSALPEVAGGGALLVDPRSIDEIRAALERLLTSPSLRAALGEHGAGKAREYRWDLCARKSWEFFQSVCGSDAG